VKLIGVLYLESPDSTLASGRPCTLTSALDDSPHYVACDTMTFTPQELEPPKGS
jgi:hypothetical protein